MRSILADSNPGAGARDVDEFRPHADFDLRARRQAVVAAVQPDRMTADRAPRGPLTSAGTMFMPGEPMK